MEIKVQEQQNSIKLMKGQKDSYGWEIKVYGRDMDSLVNELEDIDTDLKIKFGKKEDE